MTKIKKIVLLVLSVCLLFSTSVCMASFNVNAATTTNGNGGKTDVGAWFVTYNNQNMWSNNFGTGLPINYRMLMPDGSYGIPDSSNVEVIDFQIKQLAEAKIDFILFDLTNGGLSPKVKYGWDNFWITENAQLTVERLVEWNNNHEWKVKYAVAVGTYAAIRGGLSIGETTEYQAEGVLEYFYNKYPHDCYYQVNEKPLLVIHDFGTTNDVEAPGGWKMYSVSSKTDHDAGDRFTVRGSLTDPNSETGLAWRTPDTGTTVTAESATVCPGQWNHNNPEPSAHRNDGEHYINDWKTIIESEVVPKIVLISSFNDFNEDTAVFTADSSNCDTKWEEQWTDYTGKINNSMYWEITKEGIYKLRTKNKDKFKDLKDLKKGIKGSWFEKKKTNNAGGNTNSVFSRIKYTFKGSTNVIYCGIALGVFFLAVLVSAILIIIRELKRKE